MRCADLVLASTDDERDQLVRYYGADPERIEIVPPGVDHALFSPGRPGRGPARAAARRAIPCCCSSGASSRSRASTSRSRARRARRPARRARSSSAARAVPTARPSSLALHAPRRRARARRRGCASCRRSPTSALADYYRAADVCLVPSRTRVVRARRARGRRVRHAGRRRGRRRAALARRRRPHRLSSSTAATRPTSPRRSTASCADRARGPMGAARGRARGRLPWSIAAARLRRLYADLAARALVQCT